MSKNSRILLVLDKSKAYLNFCTRRKLDELKTTFQKCQKVESLKDCGVESLFGEVPTNIMLLETSDSVKKFVKDTENLNESQVKRILDAGLVIQCTVSRQSTRKLEKTVRDLGGDIISSPKGSSMAEKLVSELNLTSSVRDLLISYVGNDYEVLIPIVENLSAIPKEKHRRITEEDIYIRFPQEKGSIPPWEVVNHIFEGDVSASIESFRRITHNKDSHYLVVVSLLKTKALQYYRVSHLLDVNNDRLASVIDSSPKSIYYIKKVAKRLGSSTCEEILLSVVNLERKIKGYSSIPPIPLCEKYIVEICQMAKRS